MATKKAAKKKADKKKAATVSNVSNVSETLEPVQAWEKGGFVKCMPDTSSKE